MKDLFSYVNEEIKKNRDIIVYVFIFGLIAHGEMFINRSFFFDDAPASGMALTISLGRWAYHILSVVFAKFVGDYITLPLIFMLFSIACIALCTIIIADLLEIDGKLYRLLLSGFMVVNSSVICCFFYMLCAPYYMFGYFLATLSVYLIIRKKGLLYYVLAILCAVIATGIYQAVIPYMLTLLLLTFMYDTYKREESDWKSFLTKTGIYALYAVAFAGIYLLFMKLSLIITNTELDSYKGMDKIGSTGVGEYLGRVAYLYKEFFACNKIIDGFGSFFPILISPIAKVVVAFIFLAIIFEAVVLLRKKEVRKAAQLILLSALIPLAVNFIYVIVQAEGVYTLMLYSQVFVWITALKIVEIAGSKISSGCVKIIPMLMTVFLIMAGVLYVIYDNAIYLKANLYKERAISYYTTLITRIKSAEGYDDAYPVAMINEENKEDHSVKDLAPFSAFSVMPISTYDAYLNCYSWKTYMDTWCGYRPDYISPDELSGVSGIKDMPHYPDDGSIKVIDGIVVVNF